MRAEVIIEGENLYKKKATLQKIKVDVDNWKIFYIDNVTGEKWVEEYPHSEMHGGGSPQLRLIEKFPWKD